MIDLGAVVGIAAAVIGALCLVIFTNWFQSRPRLVTYLGHVSAHKVRHDDGSATDVYAHSVVLRNAGGKPAKNVRLSHPILPSFDIQPDLSYTVEKLPGGTEDIVIETLVPKDQVTVSYLYYPPVTWNQINGSIKCDSGVAKVVTVLPTQQYPTWLNLSAVGLMFLGIVTLLYGLVELVRWLLGSG